MTRPAIRASVATHPDGHCSRPPIACAASRPVSPHLSANFLPEEPALDLKEIKIIIELMKRNELALFELEREGFKIKLQRSFAAPGGFEVSALTAAPAIAAAPVAALVASGVPGAALPAAPSATAPPAEALREISSPMVGTFYAAASPESATFVRVGQEVSEDTVVCIIEAMKVMNEIKAETRGIVAEIVAENGKPVQFGQALFKLR